MSGAPSGVGYGEAQVYNTNGSLNAFQRIIQTQQVERQREQKALADQVKNLKTDGLRDADRNDYYKMYDDWRTKSTLARAEKDPRKRFELQSEAEKSYTGLNDLVYRSKEAAKGDDDFAKSLLDDRMRHQFKDSAVSDFQQNFKKSINDPTYIKDKSTLARQVDEDAINKELSQLHGTLLKGTREELRATKGMQGNRSGVIEERVKTVPADIQEKSYQNYYAIKPDFKKYIDDLYPGVDPALAIKDFAARKRAEGGLVEYKGTTFRENDDSWAKLQYSADRADARSARSDAAKGADDVTQRQLDVNGLLHRDVSVQNRLQGLVESNPNFGGAQLKIDLKKGSPIVTYHVPEQSEVGLDAKGNETKKVKQIAYTLTVDHSKPNAVDKLNQLVSDVTGKNISNEEYRANKGNKNKSTADIVDKPNKFINRTDLPNKAKAAGYTVKEYTEVLKSLGVTIK